MEQQGIRFIVVGTQKQGMQKSWITRIFRALAVKSYKMNSDKTLRFEKEDISVLGKKGLLVELPFEEEEVNTMPVQYLEEYIQSIIENYNVSSCYLRKELSFLKEKFHNNKKWIFRYLLFPQGLFRFLEENGIEKKNARFTIIDPGDKRIEMVLEVALEYANYLTIITNREKYFENAVDIIYEELGLMVQVQSKLIQKNIGGNVVINLDKDCYRMYNNFEENALVVDLEFTDKKHEYLASRRKDLKILYDYEIVADNRKLDPELAAEIVAGDSWRLSRFATGRETALTISEMNAISQKYGIEISKLLCLHT